MYQFQKVNYFALFSRRAGVPFHRVTSISEPYLSTACGQLLFTTRQLEILPPGVRPPHECYNCQRRS